MGYEVDKTSLLWAAREQWFEERIGLHGGIDHVHAPRERVEGVSDRSLGVTDGFDDHVEIALVEQSHSVV